MASIHPCLKNNRGVTSDNNRVPPALTAFAPGNTAREARRVGTLRTLCPMCSRRMFFGKEEAPVGLEVAMR